MCLKETNWMGEKEKELHGPRFKHWYTNKSRSISGVGIVLDNGWNKVIVDVKWIWDRSIGQKFVVEQYIFNIISAYAL